MDVNREDLIAPSVSTSLASTPHATRHQMESTMVVPYLQTTSCPIAYQTQDDRIFDIMRIVDAGSSAIRCGRYEVDFICKASNV